MAWTSCDYHHFDLWGRQYELNYIESLPINKEAEEYGKYFEDLYGKIKDLDIDRTLD